MRHRRLVTVAIVTAILPAAGCWSDIKEPQAADSIGAEEPAAGPGTQEPAGGPLPVPVDTSGPAGARDTTGPVVDPPATPAAPATPRTPPAPR